MDDQHSASPLDLPGRFEDDPERDDRLHRGREAASAALPPETPSARAHRLALARARREHGKPMRAEKRKGGGKPAEVDLVDNDIATLAARYIRDGHEPASVAERFGISRKWCEQTARRLKDLGPVGWCGKCTYDGRMRKPTALADPIPCPDCHPDRQPTEA